MRVPDRCLFSLSLSPFPECIVENVGVEVAAERADEEVDAVAARELLGAIQ